MNFWAVQILNGVSLGMLLFLIASGLSLIFGLMRIAVSYSTRALSASPCPPRRSSAEAMK